MNKLFCEKHPTLGVNAKYGKCSKCAREDGDIVLCKECGENWHDRRFLSCYDCSDFKKNFKEG